jgi:DNA-binding Lrp family transcriptional regulator
MRNIKLTSRDLSLLNDLYKNSFLAFYQIKEMHFKNKADSTVYNRLSKLIKAEIIRSIRVNLVAIHKSNMDIGVIYTITKKGLRHLKEFSYYEVKREVPIVINFNQLTHDLILTDVLRKYGGMNTKLYGQKTDDFEQIPDGIVTNKSQNCAIEVELTAKSNLRYREIISNYMTSSKFNKVQYIVKDKAIEKKIKSIIDDQFGDSKFSFVTLIEFFKTQDIYKMKEAV